MKYCTHCGAQINDDADVCIYCKTPCNTDVEEYSKTDKKEGHSVAVVSIIVLVSALICAAAYYFAEYSFWSSIF